MTRSLLLAGFATTALAFAGCGGSDSDSSADAPAAAATQADDGASAAPAGATGGDTVTVAMKNIQFEPKAVTVKVGQTIKWVNEEAVEHNAVTEDGEGPKSELFGEGGTYEYKATAAGEIKYVCTVHPGMEGTITVTK